MRIRQTGRSMVEMLGVLAIVGLLSIVGVWGIGEAFARYKANEIENYILKCVTTSYTKTMDAFYVGYCADIFEEGIPVPIGVEKYSGPSPTNGVPLSNDGDCYASERRKDGFVCIPKAADCFAPEEGTFGGHCPYLMAQVLVSDRRVMEALVRKNEKIDKVADVLSLPREEGKVVIYGRDDWKDSDGHYVVAFHFIGSAKDVGRMVRKSN